MIGSRVAVDHRQPVAQLVVFSARLAGRERVTLAGEIDLATAGRLRETLMAAISRSHASETMVVDLAEVTFLDARGIGVLVESHLAARRSGVNLTLHNPRGIVRRVLEAAGAVPGLWPATVPAPGEPAGSPL
jgi:anti-sigma B factor antagonist